MESSSCVEELALKRKRDLSVEVLKDAHKFFDSPSFKKWSLISLPLSVGGTWCITSNRM